MTDFTRKVQDIVEALKQAKEDSEAAANQEAQLVKQNALMAVHFYVFTSIVTFCIENDREYITSITFATLSGLVSSGPNFVPSVSFSQWEYTSARNSA